jgi:hypothetical protein
VALLCRKVQRVGVISCVGFYVDVVRQQQLHYILQGSTMGMMF